MTPQPFQSPELPGLIAGAPQTRRRGSDGSSWSAGDPDVTPRDTDQSPRWMKNNWIFRNFGVSNDAASVKVINLGPSIILCKGADSDSRLDDLAGTRVRARWASTGRRWRGTRGGGCAPYPLNERRPRLRSGSKGSADMGCDSFIYWFQPFYILVHCICSIRVIPTRADFVSVLPTPKEYVFHGRVWCRLRGIFFH